MIIKVNFIMCESLEQFYKELDDRFPVAPRKPLSPNSCLIYGIEFIYPNSKADLKAMKHGKVLYWGAPQFELTEEELKAF